jgi:DNA-binding MarR family transcriptional regulator
MAALGRPGHETMTKKNAPPAPPLLTVNRDALLVNGSDKEFRELLHDTLAFSARILDVRNGFAAMLSLSGGQYTVLISIRQLQGAEGVGVNTLAEHLHLSGAFVTIEVNKLVAEGLVIKKPDPTDGRRVRLTISPVGVQRLSSIVPVQAPVNDALFSSLTEEEFVVLRRAMPRLVSHGDEALALLDFYLTKNGTR